MASKKSLRNFQRLRLWTGCKLDFWYAKMASKSRHLSVGRLVCGDGFEPQRFVTWTCMHRWLWIWEIYQLDLHVKMASNDPGFLVDSTAAACSAMASREYVKIVAGSSQGFNCRTICLYWTVQRRPMKSLLRSWYTVLARRLSSGVWITQSCPYLETVVEF